MNKDPKNALGKIAEFFIERYRAVYLIIIAIILLGLQAYNTLPRESMPEVTMPYVMINTTYTGAAPQEIESQITDEIEIAIEGLEDLVSITSTSSNGRSNVTAEFTIGTDIDDKVNEITNKMSEIQNDLPGDSDTPIVSGRNTSDRAIMALNINGKQDLITLKNIAEDIQAEVEKIDGVNTVTMAGGLDREINIYVDTSKLAAYDVSIDNIRNAIEGSNVTAPGGNIELDDMQFSIRTVGEFTEVKEIEETIISVQNETPIYLKDVARVEDTYQEITSYSERYERGVSEDSTFTRTITLSITRQTGADIVGISNEIKQLLNDEKGKLYPEDVNVAVSGDEAVEVNDNLNDVVGNAISGLLIVIIVLFLFIGFRESLIVAFAIPLTLLTSFVLLQYNGMTFNTMSLVALILALGMLVDNAIVIMENIDSYRDKGIDIFNASKEATNQVAPAVFASTMTTMAAFYPMSLTPGRMGQFLRTIPITVMFAIGTSFVVSIAITPALCSRYLSRHKAKRNVNKAKLELVRKIVSVVLVLVLSLYAFAEKGQISSLSVIAAIIFTGAMFIKQFKTSNSGHGQSKIIEKYVGMLDVILKSRLKRIGTVVIAVVVFAASVATIPLGLLKIELFPESDSTAFDISVKLPQGYLLEDTGNIVGQVEEVLLRYPEVVTVISNVGSNNSLNEATIAVDIVPRAEREKSSNEIIDSIRIDVGEIAGADITLEADVMGPSSGKPINIKLKGENYETLETVANDFEAVLKKIDGVTETSTTIGDGPPELKVVVDKEKASLLGLDVNTVSSEVRKAIQGITISQFKENQDEIDIIVRTTEEQITTINDFEKIYFTSARGEKILFSQVASLVETKGSVVIEHEDLDRIAKVESNVTRGTNTNDVVSEFQSNIENYPLPEGIEVSYGGENQDIISSFTSMILNMGIAVLLVFIILAVQFNSLSQPLVILFSVPLAAIGALTGLIITGNGFGLYAFMGIVALVGIAVNDAIVLVDYINYLRKRGYGMVEAIKEGGRSRFAPVFATSITTIGGMLPLALKNLEYAQLGYALIFGLVASTVLTLIFIPVLYSLVEGFKKIVRRKIPILIDRR